MLIDPIVLDMIDNLKNNDIKFLTINHEIYNKTHNQNILINELIDFIDNEANVIKSIVIKNIHNINGLYYIPNFLTNNELDIIKNKLNSEIELESIFGKTSRRIVHYGYYYSYNRSDLKVAPAIPEYLSRLVDPDRINNIIGENIIIKKYDQLIINEYNPDQKITYHTDHTKQFGPIIMCITVGQSVPIKFKKGDIIKSINIQEGSMYIMSGDARYKWQHSLKNSTNQTRYSLTFRTVE